MAATAGGPTDLARPAARTLRVTEVEPGLALIVLARPERRNALDPATLAALAGALARRGLRGAVLAAEGSVFSAGYDLRSVAPDGFDPVAAADLIAHPAHAAFDALERCPFPVVAAVGGAALGGGNELACCCDARVASTDASFGVPAGALGLVYSASGVQRLTAIWGTAATREMLLLGRRIDAARAHGIGAVCELVAPGEEVDAALAVVRTAVRLAPRAADGNKQLLLGAVEQPRRRLPAAEAERLAGLRRASFGPDGELREGAAAFLERRIPTWPASG